VGASYRNRIRRCVYLLFIKNGGRLFNELIMNKVATRENGVWSVKTVFGKVFFQTLEEVCEFITYKK